MGLVHGKLMANATTPTQSDDGGFGSVASLLLQAFGAEGEASQSHYLLCIVYAGGGVLNVASCSRQLPYYLSVELHHLYPKPGASACFITAG